MIRSSFDITMHVKVCCSRYFTDMIEGSMHSTIGTRNCEATVSNTCEQGMFSLDGFMAVFEKGQHSQSIVQLFNDCFRMLIMFGVHIINQLVNEIQWCMSCICIPCHFVAIISIGRNSGHVSCSKHSSLQATWFPSHVSVQIGNRIWDHVIPYPVQYADKRFESSRSGAMSCVIGYGEFNLPV